MVYDLVLKNGFLVDPKNEFDGLANIALKDGKIADVCSDRNKELKALQYFDITGLYLCPGLIDCHVHLTSLFGGPIGHSMLAKAGVTTAIDFAGPVEEIIRDLPRFGKGLNIGCCDAILPNQNIPSNHPSSQEIKAVIDERLTKGAYGIKILGGHFPITPAAIKEIIEYCNNKKVFVAIHAGSTVTGSHILGMEEAVELASGNRLYVAHISAYCRGLMEDPLLEAMRAIELLKGKINIFSGSYLGTINGTVANCLDGKPTSHVTQNCLKMRNYKPSKDGLEQAIRDGYGLIHKKTEHGVGLLTGMEGVNYWKKLKTDTSISFPVNRSEVNFILAAARNQDDSFVVDVISTDGGAIPRNLLLERGLNLVKFGAMSLSEMVHKMSVKPAKLLGLANKGHLTIGADADLTIFDYEKQTAVHSLADGKFVLRNKAVVGKGGKIILSPYGEKYIKTLGIPYLVSLTAEGVFYK